ncbi:MAG: hypothetical protein ACRCZ0_08865 [Cetobacterium sp.]
MAKRKVFKDDQYEVIGILENIEAINGSVRTVTVEIDDPEVAKFAKKLDTQLDPNYHFSDGDPTDKVDFFSNVDIKNSVDKFFKNQLIRKNMKSGKSKRKKEPDKRTKEELDNISFEMAKMAARHAIDFIEGGAHMNYQEWKGTSTENLIVTGSLRDSIVGVVYRGQKEVKRGR